MCTYVYCFVGYLISLHHYSWPFHWCQRMVTCNHAPRTRRTKRCDMAQPLVYAQTAGWQRKYLQKSSSPCPWSWRLDWRWTIHAWPHTAHHSSKRFWVVMSLSNSHPLECYRGWTTVTPFTWVSQLMWPSHLFSEFSIQQLSLIFELKQYDHVMESCTISTGSYNQRTRRLRTVQARAPL